MPYGRGLPHSWQNFPVFCAPQPQVQGVFATGFGLPHSWQNLPLFTVPQLQVHESVGAGWGLPHSGQNLPVFWAPQLQVQPAVATAEVAAGACCWAWANMFAALVPPTD